MGSSKAKAAGGSVTEEIARQARELRENIRRSKAAASSLPSPKPFERELLQVMRQLSTPELLREIHVALESMKSVFEAARRLEAKGLPWDVVAYEWFRMKAAELFEARHTRGLNPEEELLYVTVVRLMKEAEPRWTAYQELQRLQERRAEPRKKGRGAQAKGKWQLRGEQLEVAWPKIEPVYGRPGWLQKARDVFPEKVSDRVMQRIIHLAQDAGKIRRLRVRQAR